MNLSAKFNVVLGSVCTVGLVVTGYLAYTILQANARQEIIERAGLMMEAALAVRGYTVQEIRPLLAPHMSEKFLAQTVPAYAATQAFEKLRETHDEYSYKEATLNPTNPRDRATDWETDIVTEFRNHGDHKEIIGVRETPTGKSLYLARPIRIKNPNCLVCHSTPDVAPASMVALYGNDNGFGWQLDEVVGAQIVSVPMAVPIAQARRAFMLFMGTLVAVFLAIIISLNVMLRRIVISPVTRMAKDADEVSKGNFEVGEFDDAGRNEIATLATSFNRMRRSLDKAMKMLAD